MKLALLLYTLAILAASTTAAPTAQPEVVPNSYIITLTPEADLAHVARAVRAEIALERSRPKSNVAPEFGHTFIIGDKFKGFHGTLTPDMVRKLKADPRVASIEPNGIVRRRATTQLSPPSWGLSRISQRVGGNTGAFTFSDKQGQGVDVFVLDGGVIQSHLEFRGGQLAHDFKGNQAWTAFDEDGHGTHVAGTIAGQFHGIAKRANIRSIKIYPATGRTDWATIIRGMEFAANAIGRSGKTSVCNMSWGTRVYEAVDRATVALIDVGCVVVTAAGNDSIDACLSSPGHVPQALNVAALDERSQMATFSDFGRCVDVFAPGTNIRSVGLNGKYENMSGTSMATPHVAGAAALILGEEPWLKPDEVVARILANASPNAVRGDVRESPNRVLFVRP